MSQPCREEKMGADEQLKVKGKETEGDFAGQLFFFS